MSAKISFLNLSIFNGERLSARKLPVVVDFHGGGFVLGSCHEQTPFCAKLARELSCIVVAVDYCMGPASQHPAALEDAGDVLSAVLDARAPGYTELRKSVAKKIEGDKQLRLKRDIDLDKFRIAISGFSSGGNIALNLLLSISPPQLKSDWPSRFPSDFPHPIPLLLFYPSFDCRQLPSERTRPAGLPVFKGLGADVNDMLMPTYLPRDQAGHPRASPGLADLKGLLHDQARMLLVLPELDSLSEHGEIWVKKVAEAGRGDELIVERFKGMKHGWIQVPESWLSGEEKRTRVEIFDSVLAFTMTAWWK
ncbi:hypothetical protein HO173_009718 [Letharia columbiana]|uniref:Alpha/beta hydrolase fold-3 domain-containing protein n=1 Tax=Letharia columbiana TaxID=112416 RepID=A0A8H6FP30_9LECA|nr:uncharacterized protein HO173_009718 [Letharia columbiana]KAF6232124.1 hypothetical protein HO173_009718 [Letharia columbiana]